MMMVAMVLSMGLSIGEPIAPCYFIFGDSLVDSGKQQSASILSKSRFCNGKTTVDVIGGSYQQPFLKREATVACIGVPHGVSGDIWVHLELKRGD
ncbi:hypothetical protein F2Q69_00033471 [Brassica cretica]|uniref:GDSL esterase/lipase n=1 Tax=Brassica cretica TaxID=69181 RepID=A0A8S9SQP0_BRACR|nr:hypothetical protein F2Q69_00033471 [Brassica cretica]